MSLVTWYVIMGVALVAMIWCAKNQRRVANAQLYSIICLVVVAISAIMALMKYFGNDDIERSISNTKQFELARLDQIAQFVSKNFTGKKVVILIRSDMVTPHESQINVIEEFKKRCADVEMLEPVVLKVSDPSQIVEGEEIPPMMSFDEERSAKRLNEKFKECKTAGADVIVNYAGLPGNPEETEKLIIWRWKKTDPQIVLSDAMDMLGVGFKPHALTTCLAAIVVYKPSINFDYLNDVAPKDLKEAFDIRFLLINEQNAPELLDASGTVKSVPPSK